MVTITQQQAIARWNKTPEPIREALGSPENADLVIAISKREGLVPAASQMLSQLSGAVLLGFVHADDFGKELEDSLALAHPVAERIAREIDEKVFRPFRADLAKLYMPPVPAAATPPQAPLGGGRPSVSAPAPLPVAGGQPPKAGIAPKPVAVAKDVPKAAPVPQGTPAGPAAKAVPSPFILQKESESEPVVASSGFHLQIDPSLFKASAMKDPAKPPAPPPKPAQLEIGKITGAAGPASFKTAPPAPRIIHYSEMKSAPAGIPAAAPAAPIAPKSTAVPVAPGTMKAAVPPMPPAPVPKISRAPGVPPPPEASAAVSGAPKPPAPPKVVNFGPEDK